MFRTGIPLFALLHDWAYPRPDLALPADMMEERTRFTHALLSDVLEIAQGYPGVGRRVEEFACRLGLDIESNTDPEFRVLFPLNDFSLDRVERQRAQQTEVEQLAANWSIRSPQDIVSKIMQYEVKAREAGVSYPRRTPLMCQKLAEITAEPKEWIALFMSQEAVPDMLEPFLKKLVTERSDRWEECVDTYLEHPHYRTVMVWVLLPVEFLPDRLMDKLMASLSGLGKIVETVTLRNQLPTARIRQLLMHGDLEIGCSTAIGLWLWKPERAVPTELLETWKAVVLRCSAKFERHWLKETWSQMPNWRFVGSSSISAIWHGRTKKSLRNSLPPSVGSNVRI
jgi:hypothetical protein